MKRSIITIVCVLILVTASIVSLLSNRKKTVDQIPENPTDVQSEIVITEVVIKEENYSGTRPEITGEGKLADVARAYVNDQIAQFGKDANEQVPDMREQFPGTSAANYTIDIKGEYAKGDRYDSIVLDEYLYTGGANGMSLYKVFTVSKDGELKTLNDIVKTDQRDAFTAYVKDTLMGYRAIENGGPIVFKDIVEKMTFDMLSDWSMDSANLILYFDKYEIAPGAAGAFPLHLPLAEVQKFLK